MQTRKLVDPTINTKVQYLIIKLGVTVQSFYLPICLHCVSYHSISLDNFKRACHISCLRSGWKVEYKVNKQYLFFWRAQKAHRDTKIQIIFSFLQNISLYLKATFSNRKREGSIKGREKNPRRKVTKPIRHVS